MEWKKHTIQTVEEALAALHTTAQGLSEAEAKRRLLEYGKNSVQTTERFVGRMVSRRLTSYLTWVFVAAALVAFSFGNVIEALCILGFLLLNASLEIYQHFHSEKAARTLQHFLIPKTRVWREKELREVASPHVVPGEIIELRAGELLPADVRFLETEQVLVNETLLHRDRGQVEKDSHSLSATPLTPDLATNIGFAGTMLVRGRAKALVIATGMHTALGDIAYENSVSVKETPFEKNIRHFSRFLVKLLLGGLVGVFGLYFLVHGEQVAMSDMVVFTLVLAIAVIPEAFPTLTALALARGSVRLAKKKILVKRLSAIEDLGSIEVLCMDKTGVLTENQLTVAAVHSQTPEALLRYALLAAHHTPAALEYLRDPFDVALWQKINETAGTEGMSQRLRALEFDPATRLQTVLVADSQNAHQATVIVRGAPEAVLGRVKNVDAFTRKTLQEWIREAGLRGERVLGVATKTVAHHHAGWHAEQDLNFEGLIAFHDPIKPGIKHTVMTAAKLGVALKVFSGDSKEVVGAVGYAAGILTDRVQVITGAEFEALTLAEQVQALSTYRAFARFSPAQKAVAARLLQKTHALGVLSASFTDPDMLRSVTVAMVGSEEGGITREAADIVLLETELSAVIEGIQESRRIFANILKYLKVTLASNFGNFYSITLAVIFLPFLPLLPLQILLLNFLSDFPMLAIATDRVDREKLQRPKDQGIHALIVTAALFGTVSSFFDLAIFKIFSAESPETMRTAWFAFSVLTEAVLLYSLRSRRWFFRASRPSFWLLLFSVTAVALAVIIPFTVVGAFLGFVMPSAEIIYFILAFTALYFGVTEIAKRWYYQHFHIFQPKG